MSPRMTRIAILASGCAMVALFACGGGSSDVDAFADDSLGLDCSPVVNGGCDPNEKCTFVIDQADPIVGHTGCAADGNVDVGEPCLRDELTGVDDCKGGLFCAGAVCEQICTVAINSCPVEFTCMHLVGVFEDHNVGLCEPACDMFAQDCANLESCYILLDRPGYPTVCAPPVPEPAPELGGCAAAAAPGVQDECCTFTNSCAQGHGCIQPSTTVTNAGLDCAYFCDPTGSVAGAPTDCSDPGPGAAPGYECVQVNHFYTDIGDLPDQVGFCINTTEWGPATCWNTTQDAHEDGVDCCMLGGDIDCPCMYQCQV